MISLYLISVHRTKATKCFLCKKNKRNTLAYRHKFIRVTVPRHYSRRNRRTLLFAFIICFPKVRIPRPSCRNGKAISILNVVVYTGDNVDPRRSVHLHLIGTTRGSQRRKKREDRRARACLVFPILWTLDPLSPGFNFYPLPLSVTLCSAPSYASSCVFLLAVPPTSFVADLPTYSGTVHATMLPGPRCETRHNATAIRSRAPASGISASPRNYYFLSFPFSSSLLFIFFFLSFYSVARGRFLGTNG